ncbi:MAG TPA: response regulator transcription factor [Caldilineaceae bacterium]|nr:response regulator transcription factor [Caldilineaceae bacterium]
MRILIVEDDLRLARLIARVLEQANFSVDMTDDGDTGLEYALTGAHRVAIIDWMVPKHDGVAICRAVRSANVPLSMLMLTARSQVEDRVFGLENGADDYLTKPFAFSELLARVRALSRRYDLKSAVGEALQRGDIMLDSQSRSALRAGVTIQLTETEWNLLECFFLHANQTLTRKQIFDQVWGVSSDAQVNMVDVYVSYLRHKLNVIPNQSNPIETVRSVGYRFRAK